MKRQFALKSAGGNTVWIRACLGQVLTNAVFAVAFLVTSSACASLDPESVPSTFNKNFEGGSLGKIEKLADARFRCYVEGQHDERGRNRQANWYYFRLDHVRDRDVTLTLTDVVGEYNDKPGACPMSGDIIPVFSFDNTHWEHFPTMTWDI